MHLEIFCDALFVRATNVSAANGYTPSQASACLLPSHCFALLASITMRAIVIDSEMIDRTRGLLF